MNTRFLFQGLRIDERTREYVLKRLMRAEKLVDPISNFEVEIDKDKKGKFRVEIMIHTPLRLYRAEETTESVEGSVDLVMDELETQITRDHQKIRDSERQGGRDLKEKMVVDELAQ